MYRTCTLILTLLRLAPVAAETIEAKMFQVHPRQEKPVAFKRTAEQPRAVVLVHGFRPEVPNDKAADVLQDWQRADSPLVKELGRDSDVFAFTYSQNGAVEVVANCKQIPQYLDMLKALGYKEIVLLGHSAGGLVVRQFVEEHPDSGVTKVIQLCAPNGGTDMVDFKFLVGKEQRAFVDSLSPATRKRYIEAHKAKIPDRIQFACVVGKGCGSGDGVLSCQEQWTADLQEQGIPAMVLEQKHFAVLREVDGIRSLSKLISDKQPRWNCEEVRTARQLILGE